MEEAARRARVELAKTALKEGHGAQEKEAVAVAGRLQVPVVAAAAVPPPLAVALVQLAAAAAAALADRTYGGGGGTDDRDGAQLADGVGHGGGHVQVDLLVAPGQGGFNAQEICAFHRACRRLVRCRERRACGGKLAAHCETDRGDSGGGHAGRAWGVGARPGSLSPRSPEISMFQIMCMLTVIFAHGSDERATLHNRYVLVPVQMPGLPKVLRRVQLSRNPGEG